MLAQALTFLYLTVGSTMKISNPVDPGSNSERNIVGANLADLWWEDARYPDNLRFREDGGTSRFGAFHGARLSVVPQYKLAFLLIEKNAGTQFNNLMAHLAGVREGYPFAGSTAPTQFNLSLSDLKQENGWRWAAFIRSPIARYLSAWGSKCQDGEDMQDGPGMIHCKCGQECRVNRTASLQTKVIAFQAHLRDSKDDMDQNKGLRHRIDPHWERQAAFFELYEVPFQKYDFVGYLRGDVNSQVRKMLRMVGASEEVADEYFPKDHVKGHQSDLGSNIQEFYRSTGSLFNELWYHEDQMLPGIER